MVEVELSLANWQIAKGFLEDGALGEYRWFCGCVRCGISAIVSRVMASTRCGMLCSLVFVGFC